MIARYVSLIAALLATLCAPLGVAAADWPARSIRMIVPVQPGGATDLVARLVAEKLRQGLQQSVVVENKPGGDELIAEDYVAKSPADGYTIFVTASPIAVNPSLRRKLPFDAARDFLPVAQIATLPFVLVMSAKLDAKTIADLAALSEKKPGGLNVAVGGSANILVTELFRLNTGIKITSIPYKGCGPATQSVLTGETDLTFCPAPALAQFASLGRVIPLAVTGNKRLSMLPNVPTAKEMGGPAFDLDLSQWIGVFVPANTPADIVARLNAEVNKVLASPDVIERIAQQGGAPTPMSVEAATKFYFAELAKFKDLVGRAKIPVED